MSEEAGNVLTFGELRKKQKEENRSDSLLELDDKFLLRVSNYLDQKKEAEGESREYKNAKRVLDKIISLREDKIVKKAKLAVKTDLNASKLDLLPEEQELFREMKKVLQNHRKTVDDTVNGKRTGITTEDTAEDTEKPEVEEKIEKTEEKSEKEEKPAEPEGKAEEKEEETGEDLEDVEEGYKLVKITSEVPEFMGTDLEAYGPFDAGEEVQIPDDNAEILVNRGNAELVEE